MDTTTNYGLSKPGLDGPADIEVLGQNADIVDTELKKAQDHRENTNVHMSTAEKGTLNSAVQSATFGGAAVPQDGTKLEIPMPTAAQVGASNPNLLINPEFRVNQRGLTTKSSTGYFVDRWGFGITTSNLQGNVTVQDYNNLGKSVTMTLTGVTNPDVDKLYFYQKLEDSDSGNSPLCGKTVTFSAKLYGDTSGVFALHLGYNDAAGNGVWSHSAYKTDDGLYSVTVSIPAGASQVSLDLASGRWLNSTDIGKSITIVEPKLEIGFVATPFSPRPYAEELAMCQRYFQVLNCTYKIITASRNEYIEDFRTLMRSTPTIIIKSANGNTDKISYWNGSAWADLSVINSDWTNEKGAHITFDRNGITEDIAIRAYITADSEIY